MLSSLAMSVLLRSRIVRGLLARCLCRLSVVFGIDTIDCLLQKRSILPDAAIDLLRKYPETIIAEENCFTLPLLRHCRRYG